MTRSTGIHFSMMAFGAGLCGCFLKRSIIVHFMTGSTLYLVVILHLRQVVGVHHRPLFIRKNGRGRRRRRQSTRIMARLANLARNFSFLELARHFRRVGSLMHSRQAAFVLMARDTGHISVRRRRTSAVRLRIRLGGMTYRAIGIGIPRHRLHRRGIVALLPLRRRGSRSAARCTN